jgi:hypothetical protein
LSGRDERGTVEPAGRHLVPPTEYDYQEILMKKLFLLLALIGAAAAAAAAFKRDDVKTGAKKATGTVAKTAQQVQSTVKDKVAAEKVPTTISGPEAAQSAAHN